MDTPIQLVTSGLPPNESMSADLQVGTLVLGPNDSDSASSRLFKRTRNLETLSLHLAKLYKRRFDRKNQISDLDRAISNYEAGRSDYHRGSETEDFDLASLYERRFVQEDRVSDLDNVIRNQITGLQRKPLSDSQKSEHLFKLAQLQEQRFDQGDDILDLDDAIRSQNAGVKLLSNLNLQKPNHLFQLACLFKRRFDQTGQNIGNVVASQEAAIKLLPYDDPTRPSRFNELICMRIEFNKTVKEPLLKDLQQLANYIKKPELNVDIVGLMEGMIMILTKDNTDKLYKEVRAHSIRLGTYCEAIRSQLGKETDRNRLRALYDDIVRKEKELSASHENLTAKYERLYKLWRAKRERISNMLSLLDSVTSQDYVEAVRIQIQRVDDSFEKIRKTLEDQRSVLKDYFIGGKALVVSSTNQHEDPLPGPVPPDNPGLEPGLEKSLPDPLDLPKAIEVGKKSLSQVGAVVGKTRYTKARRMVEVGLSITASKLEKLHGTSRKYESTVRNISVQALRHVKWWSLWYDRPYQLSNLVNRMTRKLTGVQRGFDKYKQSILGLIVRPLGDMIEDLKPFFSQVGQEVITRRFHPDMILYDAAFVVLIKSSSVPTGLFEYVKECKSRLEEASARNDL